jgi:hypothetical protein
MSACHTFSSGPAVLIDLCNVDIWKSPQMKKHNLYDLLTYISQHFEIVLT